MHLSTEVINARTPAIILVLLYLATASFLAASFAQLPDRLATHFDVLGRPDAWMQRRSYLGFIILLGMAFPLIPVLILFIVRFLPNPSINLPNREYWLAPEQRAATFSFLSRHSLWFGCIGISFVAAIHYLVYRANRQPIPQLSSSLLLSISACFIAALAVWIMALFRRFRFPQSELTSTDVNAPRPR